MTHWREFASVRQAEKLIQDTANLLEASGHESMFADLQCLLDAIERGTPYSRKEAFASVVAMCHPKCLGDVFVQGLEWSEWNSHLEMLQNACTKAFKKLESEFSKLSEMKEFSNTQILNK